MMDDPDSPGLATDGPSQPRITNRAQGGARSDKTRFIRPVERQRMRPWLIGHLDENDIPGLVWQDKRDKIFRISWKHAANQCFNMQKDTNLFERWAIHTGRHQDSDHKRWKANFRCALNSLPDVAEMKEQGVKKGNNAFKVYRFLNEKEVKRGKETRQRRKREPCEYDDEEDGVPIKEEVEDSYFNDQPGTSSEADLGPSGSSIPDLNKLVSPTSALDFNIESKEGLKQITGNMDSLQEILAAATASLAAGSDALALEKISIEQLSHLGEASKVKLDIRQSDRKRRKKEVTGILYVFLCHWCEKVFPSRVDLYQHFLIIHQDKLLSGEEYKMKRETLQQEIEDLEKKVLGFTQENIQTRDSEEVIEDGQIVDLSSNNSMTSQEIYIEDQALDLSIAGAMAKHTAAQPDVALDLSVNNSNKQKAPQKNLAAKGVVKRRRSSAMDVDYTVKFGNYGLAGAPRTKRQLSLLLKKKEEEEEKQRKQAEAQHSMEDIAHAEILISLKSASNEENESESIELDDKAVKEAVNEQAQDVDMEEDGETEKITDETNAELEQGQEAMEKPEDEETGDSCVQESDKVDGAGDREENIETVVKEHVNTDGKDNTSGYKCGICMESFENVLSLNEHLNGSENQCFAKLMSLRDVPVSQLGLSLPHKKSEKLCIVCKMQFQSVEELNEHQKSHPNLNPCYTCGEEFTTVNELLSHIKHKKSEIQDENGPAETIKKEAVSVDNGGDSASTSSVSKITDQKNLKGEPVVSPAAGSETVTGMAMNDSMSADGDIVDNKGDAAVKQNEISAEQVRKDHGDLRKKHDGDKKDVKNLSGNDVTDGEQLIESDAEHQRQTQSEFDDNIPKTLNLLSPKVKPDSSPGAVNLLNSDEIRKDMVLCGLCNLRLDFKDVQSHLESHKFAQDRKIEVKEDCPCMICDKMIPIKTFYCHLRSHSVYDLSVALSTQMNVEKNVVKKGKCVCNLCYSTFNTQSELMHHVKSHLGPRNASEPKKATAQKRKLPVTEKKGKKLKTKDNAQSRKSAKKKPAKNSSASLSRSSDKKLANEDSFDLFKLRRAAVVHSEGGKSESSPALTAALNRKPKCETSIMALFAARNKKMPVVAEHVDKLEGSKAPKKEEVGMVKKTESADSDVSNNESEMSSQVGEEKISEDENFLAASRRLQEFVTLKEYEQSIKVSEAIVETDPSKQTGTVESEDNSSTTKSKKSLQQKILLVRHGDVKVATPFFSPVTSVPVESSQQNPVALYKPVISQTKRLSNVPVLSPTKGTNVTGKSKKPTSSSKSSAIVSGSSASVTIPAAVPVSLVRNLYNLPVGINTSLKHVSAVTLKKGNVSNLQATRTPIPSVSSVSQITVDPSAMTKVSGSPTSLGSSTSAQVPGLGLTQEVSTNMQTPSVSLSSASKLASSQTLAQVPGGMNVNIVMAKSQSSSNKSVVPPGMSNAEVKSPVYHLAFVSVGDKTPETGSVGINSFQDRPTKPVTSTINQRVFKCNNCRQPLSSIKQLTNHVCKTASKRSPGQQSVSLTLMASSSEYDLKTSGIMSVGSTTPHTKMVSTPTILKPSLSTLKFPLVGSIPSTNSGTQASGVNVLSSPVGIGMDKAKFVLSRSAILAKSLAVPLNSTSSNQTGSVLSSSALSSAEALTMGSNLLRVSAGSLSSAGIKEGNQALALYPCGICKQIYMNQDSFIKHMQEHVSTKLEIKDEPSSLVESVTSKTISPELKVGNSVQRQLSKDEDMKMNISGTTLKDVGKTTAKTIENLFISDLPNSVVEEEVPEVSDQNCELVNQSIECAANESGKTNIMACRRCMSVFDNEKALAEHYKGVHPNTSSFRCYSDSCAKSFCKEKDVDFHYSMEHIHKCATCLHRFQSYAEFENHAKNHAKVTDSTVIVCTMCNKEFMTKSDMNEHLVESASCRDGLQYETSANILCDDCHGYFSNDEPFVEHFRSHYIKLAYRCCICLMEYSVAKSADLQVLENKVLKHMNGHVAQVSDKLYFCHVCYFLFPNREVQSFHMASDSHKEQIANKLGNKQQNTKFVKKLGLPFKRKTVKIPSSMPAKKFRGKKDKDDDSYTTEQVLSCVACNVCFSTLFQLKAHKAIWHRSNRKGQHVPTNRNLHPTGRWDKLLVCELCGKRFFSVNLLQTHRENHDLMVSQLMCKELSCMRIFATKSEMKSHVCAAKTSKVADSTSMATEQCGALTMFTPNELEQYIIQHDASDSEFHLEKAALMIERLQADLGDFFHCMFCKKTFARSDPLKQHMVKTHSKKLFQCVDCEQYFHKNASLMIHRRDCAVRSFSDQDFHTKKQYYGCDMCYRSFIQLVSLACYIADMKTDKTDEIIEKAVLKMSLDRLKLENENKSSGSLVSNSCGKFVCMECRNEYCDANDLYTCMRSRLDHQMKKVLSSQECENLPDTVGVFSNDSMFYCSKCENIVCFKAGEMCLATLEHPCIHSETLI